VGCLALAGLGMRKLGAWGVVVATDPVSADADCDNGSAALHGPARRRRDDEREAHRVARARKRRPGTTRPGPAASGGANLYARCPHVVTGSWSLRGLEIALLIYLNRLMRDAAYELRKIYLLRGWVNKLVDLAQPSGLNLVYEAAHALLVRDERACLDASNRLAHVLLKV
jgi:hypothetical protein